MVTIQFGEFRRLCRVFETSKDLMLAHENKERQEGIEGTDALKEYQRKAIEELERWYEQNTQQNI